MVGTPNVTPTHSLGIIPRFVHHVSVAHFDNEVRMYGFLADLMVGIHVGYVAYVVVGQLFIWLGLILCWRWVRNVWFRITHMVAIAIVVFEELFGIRCPLSVWEEQLRELAGQPTTGETFLGRLLHSILFYDFQPWVFTVIYLTTGIIVLLTFVCFPPRRKAKSEPEPSSRRV